MAQTPEFTQAQARFAKLLITKEAGEQAKITHRYGDSPKTYRLVEERRRLPMLAFAEDDTMFALKLHQQPGRIGEPLSPFFMNFRDMDEEMLDAVTDVLAEQRLPSGIVLSTGIPRAGNAIAEGVSKKTNLPYQELMIKVGEGPEAKIVPNPNAPRGNKEPVLIIDDLITGADSKWAAATIISGPELNYSVGGFMVAVDREQGGSDQLRAAGHQFIAALGIRRLLDHYHQTRDITPALYQRSMDYLSPKG